MVLELDEERMYNLEPPESNLPAEYEFTITMEADGGAQLVTSSCKIILGCSATHKYLDAEEFELESQISYTFSKFSSTTVISPKNESSSEFVDWPSFFEKKDLGEDCEFTHCELYKSE